MFYSISFKTFKQMAYAFSLYDAQFGIRLYYSKRIDFCESQKECAESLWNFLKVMSADEGEDFSVVGCHFREISNSI